jgi:4'-phosphopantetheinyl transferase
VRPIAEINALAERCFSSAVQAAWRAVPGALQLEAFFDGWTRKEAFIKAIGDGLSYPLDRFTVSLAPGEPACLLRVEDDPLGAVRWQLHDLRPDPAMRRPSSLKEAVSCASATGHDGHRTHRTKAGRPCGVTTLPAG